MVKKIKFIQVNIYRGRYLLELTKFLRNENPDIITMQEVSGGKFNLNSDKSLNLFEFFRKQLKLNGVYCGDLKLINSKNSSMGNAVFSKFKIVMPNLIKL